LEMPHHTVLKKTKKRGVGFMFFLWKCAIRYKCTIEKIVITQCIRHVYVKQAFGDFVLDICSWKHLQI